jgi:hypothetical protein
MPTFTGAIVIALAIVLVWSDRALGRGATQQAPSVAAIPIPDCSVKELPMVPQEIAALEKDDRNEKLRLSRHLDPTLLLRVNNFLSAIQEKFHFAPTIASGHRPPLYQEHFWFLRNEWMMLHAHGLLPECTELAKRVDDDLKRHRIFRCTNRDVHGPLGKTPACVNGQPLVAPPSASQHTLSPAHAVDIDRPPRSSKTSLDDLACLAGQFGLERVHLKDLIHYELSTAKNGNLLSPSLTSCVMTPPQAQFVISTARVDTLSVTVLSPVRIEVIDPDGHRIGWDIDEERTINEIGEGATYTYTNNPAFPQIIDINQPKPGRYRVAGVATGTGRYRLIHTRFTEDGRVLDGATTSGTVHDGERLVLTDITVPQTDASPQPPTVVPPEPIVVQATERAGTRPARSPALRAWLARVRAFDDGQGAPDVIAPLVENQAVTDDTLFRPGLNTVYFRAQDDAGQIAMASSAVRVEVKRNARSTSPPNPPPREDSSPPDKEKVNAERQPTNVTPPPSHVRTIVTLVLLVIVVASAVMLIKRRRSGR